VAPGVAYARCQRRGRAVRVCWRGIRAGEPVAHRCLRNTSPKAGSCLRQNKNPTFFAQSTLKSEKVSVWPHRWTFWTIQCTFWAKLLVCVLETHPAGLEGKIKKNRLFFALSTLKSENARMATQMEFSKNSVDFSKQSYPFAPQEHIPHGERSKKGFGVGGVGVGGGVGGQNNNK